MYTLRLTLAVAQTIKEKNKKSPSVEERLHELCNNPFEKAQQTHIASIGEYFVNAGRYCILFDIDEENEVIDIKYIVTSALLHKIRTGRLQQDYLTTRTNHSS